MLANTTIGAGLGPYVGHKIFSTIVAICALLGFYVGSKLSRGVKDLYIVIDALLSSTYVSMFAQDSHTPAMGKAPCPSTGLVLSVFASKLVFPKKNHW